jgi:hypothetical protein
MIPQEIKNLIQGYVTDLNRLEVNCEFQSRIEDGFLAGYVDLADYVDGSAVVIQMFDIFGNRLTTQQLFRYIVYPLHLQFQRVRNLKRKRKRRLFSCIQ